MPGTALGQFIIVEQQQQLVLYRDSHTSIQVGWQRISVFRECWWLSVKNISVASTWLGRLTRGANAVLSFCASAQVL